MLKFSLLTRGDPRNPPLIFLHGFLGCKEDWRDFFPFFEQKYHCLAFDLPGHGETPYCEEIARVLREEINRVCEIKPILVGYSMGGRIALSLKETARSLVIISAHLGLKTEKEKEERKLIDQMWSRKLLTLPFEQFLSEWYAQPIFSSLPRDLIKSRMNQNPQNLSQVLLQMSLANQPHCEALPCPALFLHGEHDSKYKELYGALSLEATVRQIAGCGHAAHLGDAAECSHLICDWLS